MILEPQQVLFGLFRSCLQAGPRWQGFLFPHTAAKIATHMSVLCVGFRELKIRSRKKKYVQETCIMLYYPAPALDFLKNQKKKKEDKGKAYSSHHPSPPPQAPTERNPLPEDSEADLFPLTHQVQVSLTCFLSVFLLFTWFWGPHHPPPLLSVGWGGQVSAR